MNSEFEKIRVRLEEKGEEGVRIDLAHGVWDGRRKRYVEEWLRSKEEQREGVAAAARDAREGAMLSAAEDSNSIARQALANSRKANWFAVVAIVLSAIVAAKEVFAWFVS